jgi:hypothetical protein
MLLVIQNKVLGSPALNGGFDTLIHKMDNFEKRQDQVIENVKEIHEAVYNPDEGLFARIRDAEASKANEIHTLSTKITEIELRQKIDDKNHEKDSESEKELKKLVEGLKSDVADVKRGYELLKWFSITIGGGLIIGAIKAFYDYIIQHVNFV